MTPFTERTLAILKRIPSGKVMTYGQVAGLAGSPRAARQVVRILHAMSRTHNLPWHRVINSKGEIAVRDDESYQLQKMLLELEEVEIRDGRFIDLERYQYDRDSE